MITMLGMITSFVLSLWAVRVSAHEAICDPEKALRIMQSNDFDETAFYLDRISDYVVATKRNSSVHRRQATALSIAGMLILVGIVGHGAYFTAHIKKEIDMRNSKEPKSGNNSETLKREETPDNTEKKIDKSSYSSDSLTRRSGYSSDIAYTRKT